MKEIDSKPSESTSKSLSTSMFKHQKLISDQALNVPCPENDACECNMDAYRWCQSPLENHHFLPNLLEGRPIRQLKGDEKHCGMCALSFFDSLDHAKRRFSQFSQHIKKNLGYTHICHGRLVENDGKRGKVDNGHFNFFEYNGVSLIEKFKIIDSL